MSLSVYSAQLDIQPKQVVDFTEQHTAARKLYAEFQDIANDALLVVVVGLSGMLVSRPRRVPVRSCGCQLVVQCPCRFRR